MYRNACDLSGGPGFDTYEWLDGSNTVIGNGETVEVSQGGTYTLNVVLGSGMMACQGTAQITIEQFDPLPNALNALGVSVCNQNTALYLQL